MTRTEFDVSVAQERATGPVPSPADPRDNTELTGTAVAGIGVAGIEVSSR